MSRSPLLLSILAVLTSCSETFEDLYRAANAGVSQVLRPALNALLS